jgi:hypothetical protein
VLITGKYWALIDTIVSIGWLRSVRWNVFVGKVDRSEMENAEQLVSAIFCQSMYIFERLL